MARLKEYRIYARDIPGAARGTPTHGQGVRTGSKPPSKRSRPTVIERARGLITSMLKRPR